ncbi:hypothetical protein Nepgr_020244 [Nepenthes gracilis]|uniref:DNA mismatch repair protein n=1 Tax=Nepenthes gracilis TaxID=150966 RepID=A0AAD3XV28_NEPGR|nr:hypothetical protein Nepgr_020244 [Nepenthes gracilis]
MGKQKQQVISRFFAPSTKIHSTFPSNDPSPSSSQPPLSSNLPTPTPKIAATVSFSPVKRLKSSEFISPQKPSKILKLSPHTQNPIPALSNSSLHRKFLQKLLEPPDHLLEHSGKFQESSLAAASSSNPKYTPLEQQVLELKNKYPDVLLMIEVGYRYRFFGKDADIAARVLGIYAHLDHNFLTASIPTFRLNVHVRRLVSEGYKVGVVKQTETASIKAHGSNRVGPFCRGLSALYTKATIEAAKDLGGGEEGCMSTTNYLFCVVEKEILIETVDCRVESGFDVTIGVVALEISTGDAVYGEFNDNFSRAGLEAVILSLSPAELLLGEPLSKQTEKMLLTYAGPASNVCVERISCDCFKDGGALAEAVSFFENTSESSLEYHQKCNADVAEDGTCELAIKGIMALPGLALKALAISLRYLKQFGFERIVSLGASFRPLLSNMEMRLSANALQQLEVLKNNSDGSQSGSLLQCMNHTLTIYGSRLLKHWVTHPLCDRNIITARLDAVAEIAESTGGCKALQSFGGLDGGERGLMVVQPEVNYVLSSVLTTLGRSLDIQRGITRIFHKTATPSEFIAVLQAILLAGKQLQQLHIEGEDYTEELQMNNVRSPLLRKLIQTASSSSVISKAAMLLSSLNTEAADKGDLLNLLITSDGQYPEVAKAWKKVQLANEELESLIGLYHKQLGMRNLEYSSVSGTTYLIELPSESRVPPSWVKVNSTQKMVRYHPPEVLIGLDQLSLANEELAIVCQATWDNFMGEFTSYYTEFHAAVQAFAALDCLHSLAILARNKNYVCPAFVDDEEPVQIQISSGRHPVLETILQGNFVPNDSNLHAHKEFCQIITGPNMGGKSCYIRQVALITIMAQVGSFVPALSAKLHVLDGVYTRMGASENIQQGRSTFLEELTEASNILHGCTDHSLVILDELGRGTSTHDGEAIAYATLHYLLDRKNCLILFVTHYPKIADIKEEFPRSVGVYHVSYLASKNGFRSGKFEENFLTRAVDVDHEDITYLYKLVPGVSEKSFGFQVARLAQLPASCIQRAMIMAAELEAAVRRRRDVRREETLHLTKQILNSENDSPESTSKHSDLTVREETVGNSRHLTNACNKFFSYLNLALGNDDERQSLELLKLARAVSLESIALQQ